MPAGVRAGCAGLVAGSAVRAGDDASGRRVNRRGGDTDGDRQGHWQAALTHAGPDQIRAFDIASGALAAAAKLNQSGTFRLALPPGGYVLVTNIIPERGGSRAGVQRAILLTLARGQRRRAVKIAKPTAKSSAAGLPGARAAYSQESGAITPGTIAYSFQDFGGATGELAVWNAGLSSMLQTDTMNSAQCRNLEVAGEFLPVLKK